MKRVSVWRYLSIAVAFCLVAVIYLGRMFYVQISGKDDAYQNNHTTRTVIVPAVRGEIHDRNGKALVTNHNIYDLVLSYIPFQALDRKSANETCLSLLNALTYTAESGKHEERYFPFDGTYPNYAFSSETLAGDTRQAYYLERVLKNIGLPEDADVSQIVDYYVTTYDLLATYSNDQRIFKNADVDRLIRLYYDMDAVRFAANGEYTLAKDVSMTLVTYVEELGLRATTFSLRTERVYQYQNKETGTTYASHILGTVGPIYAEEWEYYNEQGYQMSSLVGKSGCEAAFEQYLHGTDGIRRITEDAAGNVIATEWIQEPIAGKDIRLTIDIDLQIAAEDGLHANVSSVGGNCNAGAAVAMDPDTFEVLAIASYPTYDLNLYNILYPDLAEDPAKPLLNRAVSGTYAPGSTFKLGVATAGMMSGKITSASTIVCTGKTHLYHLPTCSTYPHHGSIGGAESIDVEEAIADSCNTYFYELGYQLGIDEMNAYMKKLGFGQPTGFELGGASGVLAGPDFRLENNYPAWMPGDVLSAAIGQSDNTASPLQLACYLSTISNGGLRYNAHLLHSVYRFKSDTAEPGTPVSVLDQLEIPASVCSTIFNGMRDMIKGSTTATRNMANVPVTVGGKTGTAQTSSDDTNALFVAAAPYDNPEIVVSVVLEKGRSGTNATYTAGKILEKFYEGR